MIVLATAGERAQVDFVQASLLVLNWLRQLKGRDEEHIKFDLNGKSYNHDAAQAKPQGPGPARQGRWRTKRQERG